MFKDELKQLTKSMLSEKRYYHCLCVASQAETLARIFGVCEEAANTAGLLHDILKNQDNDKMLIFAKKFDIMFDSVEFDCPKLWHSIVGAEYVRHELKIQNDDIINSIRYHTTGRPNMSLLEKIIFVADCTSLDRRYPDAEYARQLSYQNIDDALVYCLKFLINYLSKHNRIIHPNSINAYNFYISKESHCERA